MSKIIIGIDLGTTNSCVATWDRSSSSAKVLENAEGKRTTPSVVAFDVKTKKFIIGEAAKRQSIMNPTNTFYGVKRLIGNKFNDVGQQVKNSPFKIVQGKDGDARIADQDGKIYAASQISAQVLMKIKQDAEAKLGQKVTGAVITVPAYFNDAQRQATKDAGEIAGLTVERIINEPTAAALAYGIDKISKKSSKIAVYDLGGGTFDISILELEDGVFEVLSTSGDTMLGGENFDDRIIEYLKDEFKKQSNIDISNDKTALQRIKVEAERAKIELSSREEVNINLPFLATSANGPQHLDINITRGKLESLVSDLVKKTEDPCNKAMKDANLKTSDIDEVILVGGMTRMPYVQECVAKIFNKSVNTLNKSVNPDEVVALGAAVQAAVLCGDTKDVVLLDVTPLSLGIETMGGVFTKLIDRNSNIPCKKSQVFSTASDNQSAVTIRVAQGEREIFEHNKLLGQFNLEGIAPAPRGVPQIEVTFDIDVNGIVHVSAKDKSTNKEQRITIQASGGLSDEEIEKMKKDAEAHAEEDKKYTEYISLKSRSESLISSTESAIKDNGDKLPDELKTNIESKLTIIKDILKDSDISKSDDLQKAYDDLSAESIKIGEILYKSGQDQEKGPEEQA